MNIACRIGAYVANTNREFNRLTGTGRRGIHGFLNLEIGRSLRGFGPGNENGERDDSKSAKRVNGAGVHGCSSNGGSTAVRAASY
jgi:hypothetical protein